MGYAAIELDDVYDTDDGRRVVLLGQDILVVSALAALLLDRVAAGDEEIDALVGAVLEVFGQPPSGSDARAVVESNLDDLVTRGLIAHVSGG